MLSDQKYYQGKPDQVKLSSYSMYCSKGRWYLIVRSQRKTLGKGVYWVLGLEWLSSGLARWGDIDIGLLFTLAAVDCWTQESEGNEMGLEKPVQVLISKLFSWFRLLFSRSWKFLEHTVELLLLVLNVNRASWFQFPNNKDRVVATSR